MIVAAVLECAETKAQKTSVILEADADVVLLDINILWRM